MVIMTPIIITLLVCAIGLFHGATSIGQMYCYSLESCPVIVKVPDIPGVDSPLPRSEGRMLELEQQLAYEYAEDKENDSRIANSVYLFCPITINASEQQKLSNLGNGRPGIFDRIESFFADLKNLFKWIRLPSFQSEKKMLATVTSRIHPAFEKLDRMYHSLPSNDIFIFGGLLLTICGIYPAFADFGKVLVVIYIMYHIRSFREIF